MIRNSELWGGLFWLAIGAFVIWAGRDMGLGRLHEPGPGFAFYWIGILMCALSLSVIGQAFVSGGPSFASLWAGARWRKVLVVIVLLLVLMWFVDPVDGRLATIVALVATFGVWAALTKWLKIGLPAGILSGILG